MKALYTWIGAAALAAVTLAVPAAQQPPAEKVTIEGMALNFTNAAPGGQQRVRIRIERWSTPQQREDLIKAFQEKQSEGPLKAQEALLKALEKQKEVGRFNFPGYTGPDPNNNLRLGTAVKYAMSFPMDGGGRRIVVLTPRIIGFKEAVDQPRTYDYPFSLFEMRFDASGKGEGRMAYATQIRMDKAKSAIELENYSTEPLRLNQLQLTVEK